MAVAGRRSWQEQEPSWEFEYTRKRIKFLPEVKNLDVIELGCGAAYVSAWLARRVPMLLESIIQNSN